MISTFGLIFPLSSSCEIENMNRKWRLSFRSLMGLGIKGAGGVQASPKKWGGLFFLKAFI